MRVVLISLIIISLALSQNTFNNPAADNSAEPFAFNIGEKLTFKIRYGFIKAGTGEMKILSLTEENGSAAYHIQTTAKSAKAFNWVYKVNDVVNTFVDARYLHPLRFEKLLREGGYKADLFVDFYQQDSLAKVEFIRYKKNMKIRSRKNYDVKIPPGTFDVLSAFYYIRSQPLEVGKSVYLTNHEKKKTYDLEIIVHKKETIKVSAGKFRCLLIEPLLKGEGIFKQKGRLKIWVTDDELKIPVQMTSEIAVGHITTELVKIEGIDQAIPARLR